MTKSDLDIILSESIANRDWVNELAKYKNPKLAFADLKKQICRAVSQFNKLDDRTRLFATIKPDVTGDWRIDLMRVETEAAKIMAPLMLVTFEAKSDHILLERKGRRDIKVHSVWDRRTRTARFEFPDEDHPDVFASGDPNPPFPVSDLLTASQLCERFLAPLFWPE